MVGLATNHRERTVKGPAKSTQTRFRHEIIHFVASSICASESARLSMEPHRIISAYSLDRIRRDDHENELQYQRTKVRSVDPARRSREILMYPLVTHEPY